MAYLEGHLLIAVPQLYDPNFYKTVVLLVKHNDQGALGLVLNRPTSKTVKELWQEVGDAPCQSELPVHLGGPVPGPLMALHSLSSLGEMQILPGLFFAAEKDHLDQLVLKKRRALKVFVGHSGWGAGQLENELKMGGWLTAPATTEHVFDDGDDLWERVSKSIGTAALSSMLKLKRVPEDPSLN